MKTLSQISAGLMTFALATAALAQSGLPTILQLPTDDFTYTWGNNASVDDRDHPDFNLKGVETPFSCSLTGSFRPGSHMRDYYNQREFEQTLNETIYFIQVATQALNDLYLANQLDWAIMTCVIPDAPENEDATQERVDKALERAERQRDRRREREAREDN